MAVEGPLGRHCARFRVGELRVVPLFFARSELAIIDIPGTSRCCYNLCSKNGASLAVAMKTRCRAFQRAVLQDEHYRVRKHVRVHQLLHVLPVAHNYAL